MGAMAQLGLFHLIEDFEGEGAEEMEEHDEHGLDKGWPRGPLAILLEETTWLTRFVDAGIIVEGGLGG